MITIGVTGGVGAGKSEVLGYLKENYNCRILMSDNAAKELERPGGALYEPLLALLTKDDGRDAGRGSLLCENGGIDTKEMARRIFADPLLLKKINELVHPAVNRYILDEIAREKKRREKEFFILESALLIENGYDRILDAMWYIYCEESVRADRLRSARGYSDEKIRSIMMSQLSEEVFRRHCDTVIDNTGPFTAPRGAASQIDAAVAALREKFGTASDGRPERERRGRSGTGYRYE